MGKIKQLLCSHESIGVNQGWRQCMNCNKFLYADRGYKYPNERFDPIQVKSGSDIPPI